MKEAIVRCLVQVLAFKGMRRILVFIVLSFAILLNTAIASPGDLDPTFGIGGKVTDATFPGDPRRAAIQSDGKIVVVGNWGDYVLAFGLVRYNSDGSLDTTFGSGGRSTRPSWFTFNSLTVQPDDKIVVVGTVVVAKQGSCFGLARYNADGSLDTSFGQGGYDYPCASGYDAGIAVTIGPSGNIVAAGDSQPGFALVIYNAAIVTTPNYAQARAVAIQSDGKIVVTGDSSGSFVTARYNTNGALDTTFGNNGSVTTFMAGEAFSVAIQADGKIVVAGSTCLGCPKAGYSGFGLVRYNPDGSLDATFDSDGKVETAVSGIDSAYSVAIQSNGKIVAAGTCYGCQTRDFAVVRYSLEGSLDSTFGNGGITTVDFDSSSDNAFGIVLDGAGRAVISGGSAGRTALARLQLDPIGTPFDFDGDRRADISVFRPSNSTWYLDRSTAGFYSTQFGLSTDNIVPADYDGDGKTDIAVFRDGTWWIRKSATNAVLAYTFGQPGDIPVPADYNGDGRGELAVYRNGQWWELDLLTGNSPSPLSFGLASDKPVPADYDGDGEVDEAVYRSGEWHLNRSSLGYTVVDFGLPTDTPVVGDYDGDGKADLAVFREGTWYLQQSTAGFSTFQFGLATDTPAPADYDGDGKTDETVYRDGVWYQRRSTGSIFVQQFGLTGDKPLAASFIR